MHFFIVLVSLLVGGSLVSSPPLQFDPTWRWLIFASGMSLIDGSLGQCNVNRVRLISAGRLFCATSNACSLINLTFKRQKSPKFTADGRMHEEIRGQARVFL